MSKEISNTDDIIDSRDVIARIEALKSERDAAESQSVWENSGEASELEALEALASKAEGSPDWNYGVTLIRDSYFRDYAEQLADDIGAIDRNANWPVNCIDWDEAAGQLKVDYFQVDFGGVTYWIRW